MCCLMFSALMPKRVVAMFLLMSSSFRCVCAAAAIPVDSLWQLLFEACRLPPAGKSVLILQFLAEEASLEKHTGFRWGGSRVLWMQGRLSWTKLSVWDLFGVLITDL